jgi:hypothetical protein
MRNARNSLGGKPTFRSRQIGFRLAMTMGITDAEQLNQYWVFGPP